MSSVATLESNSPDSPKSSPSHQIDLGMMVNACDPNMKRSLKFVGKRIDFMRMISNKNPLSEIPTMKPTAEN